MPDNKPFKKAGSIIKVSKAPEKVIKKLIELERQTVWVGHFGSQGAHSRTSWTYPQILSYWARGGRNGTPKNPREVFRLKLNSSVFRGDGDFKRSLNNYLKSRTNAPLPRVLESFGTFFREQYREVFGPSGFLMPPNSRGKAMLWTGELKQKVAYRTSKNPRINWK